MATIRGVSQLKKVFSYLIVMLVSLGFLTGCETMAPKRVRINADIGTMVTALEKYKNDVGAYPTNADNLSALLTAPASSLESGKWKGPYLQQLPKTPWGKNYLYEFGNVWLVAPEGPQPFGPGWQWNNSISQWVKREDGYIIRVWSPDGVLVSVPITQFGYWPSFVYTMLPVETK
jgi:type II secretion system protein G